MIKIKEGETERMERGQTRRREGRDGRAERKSRA